MDFVDVEGEIAHGFTREDAFEVEERGALKSTLTPSVSPSSHARTPATL